jgi:hypothetical protein
MGGGAGYTIEEIEEVRERTMREREEQGLQEPSLEALVPIAEALNALLASSDTPVDPDPVGAERATRPA